MIGKGKISEQELQTVKSAFPSDALFKWTSPNKKDEVIFKAVSHELMTRVIALIRDAEIQGRPLPIQDVNERIFDSCVVWPQLTLEEKQTSPVGFIPSIVKVIQEKSGFVDIDIFQRVLGPDTFTTILKDFDYWSDLTEADTEELKANAGPFSLFRIRIGRWIFVIRPMTRVDIQVSSQSNDDQLTLARSVTMWPTEVPWETIPAGVIELLARKANDISGWDVDATCEEI